MRDDRFLAGAAREDITPEVGTLLYGYAPDTVSESVHDPLQVTAAAFRQGEEKAVLMTVTVGDFGTALCDEIRVKIGTELGIGAGRVIVAATHTHSAPNVSGMPGWGEIDRPYVDRILFPAMRRAAKNAADSLRPAEISVGTVRSEVGVNRREQRPDGSIALGQNPWGCYDPNMTLIALRERETGKGILNLIHYGCHGTAAGKNHEITRDWSGVMTDRLEAQSGVLTAYLNGAQGDVGPRLTNGRTTGDIRFVEELGGVAARDAMRAWEARGAYHTAGLRVLEGEVCIPRRPLRPEEEVRSKLDSCREPEKLINIQRLEYEYYRAQMDEYERGCPPWDGNLTLPQTILCLGEAAFVPFPFEVFAETSMRLRAYSPVRHTLCLSNANGYNAYLPTEDQLVRGGYEVGCFRYSGAHPLIDRADQVILEENLRIMSPLSGQ